MVETRKTSGKFQLKEQDALVHHGELARRLVELLTCHLSIVGALRGRHVHAGEKRVEQEVLRANMRKRETTRSAALLYGEEEFCIHDARKKRVCGYERVGRMANERVRACVHGGGTEKSKLQRRRRRDKKERVERCKARRKPNRIRRMSQ